MVHSAEIIAFPRPVAEDPQLRLQRALQSLEAALAAQREAIAAWRGSIDALKASVGGLHGSMNAYQTRLAELSGSVAQLGETARGLDM